MRKHFRFTALLLAVSLLCNTTIPVMAEGSLDTSTAVEETNSATEAAAVPDQETPAPSEETAAPSEETSVPTEETTAATVEASSPAEETTAPMEETSEPTESTLPQPIAAGTVVCNSSVNIRSGPGTGYEILDSAYNGQRVSIYEIVSTQEGDWGRIGEGRWICLTYVTLDGQESTEQTTAPTEEITEPTEAETTPTVESTTPAEEITDPSEESSAPTEETTDPSEESSVPTEETTDPSEESSEPTEETTDPLTELEAQLAAISLSIQFAEVVPEEMSLTWWAMNCGKLQTDLHLVAENMLAASPEGVELSENAIPQELLYQPENSTLYISSAKDLISLSYVAPSEYQQMTLIFLPTQQENQGFYLIDPIDELRFSPLGSLEAPFRGKLVFHEQTGPIQLDCPLFDALSDEVEIEGLILECRAEEVMEGGLLAKWIAHTYGGAEWDITLSAPEMVEDAVAYLPSLVGGLSTESDITLTLTNESGLRVIGSGLLCAQMGMNARLAVSGLSVLPTVTGYGENTGGLVGQMQAGSTLLVSGESLVLSQVTGSQNVGGIVGTADNPNLSLPAILGAEGAVICGQNVGALAGNLTLTAGEYAITQNASGLTLNGSTNTGGLFGLLTLNDATLSLTTSLDGLSFGVDALGSNGSIFGTLQASTLKDTLILNGESIHDRTGFEGLAGSIQSEDPLVTVEEVQQMMDQLASAELVPGEMSLTWWAVVCEKVTAEEIAAEINGTPLPSEVTEPTQEPEQPSETTPQEPEQSSETTPQEPEQAAAAEPTLQTEAPEETTLPQDSPSGEEYPDAQEDILSQEDVLLEEYVPMAAAFSLNPEGSATTFSMDDASMFASEENDSVTDVLQDENVPVLLAAGETESEESNTENGIMPLTDVGGVDFVDPDYLTIGSAADLIRLSYVSPSEYENKTFQITATKGATNIYDVTKSVTDQTYGELSFQGLGNDTVSFKGKLTLHKDATNVKFLLNRAFFNSLADSATIEVNLYSAIGSTPALLAETVTDSGAESGTWTVKVWGVDYSYPLLGTIAENAAANVNLTLRVGTFNGDQFTDAPDYSALTVHGGGYLCGTMGNSAALNVTLQAVEGTTLSIPKVNNSSGDAGNLVGTMGSSGSLTVTLPSGYDTLPIGSVTASGNAGGLVGKMDAGSTVSVKKADNTTNAIITTDGVTITGTNAGGLVGYMENAATLNADWSSFSAPTVTATEYAGGLVGYAENPGSTFEGISVTDATISGKRAGGLVGYLKNTKTASFSLNANVQNLTISGSESAGSLFGELQNDKGNEEPITYSIQSGTSFTISSITLTGGDKDGSKDAGGLIGKYYTNDLKNTLEIKNISVSSSSSATSYGGVIGKVDGSVAAYVEFSNVSATSSEPSSNYYGGLVGWLSDPGHMVKVGENVTINATSTGNGSSGTGGLIGYMPNGVLYITGDSSPVLNYDTITKKNANSRGWILGNRGNTLVFTDIPNWDAEKGSETNDTGVWGQVLRVDSLSGLFVTGTTEAGEKKTISQYISENHSLTIGAVTQETITGSESANVNALAVSNVVDFAKIALRLQLDETSCLKFAKVNDTDASGDLVTSDTITISLKTSIDLNGTGLTGLTRDVNKDNKFSPIFNIQITGILTGKDAPTITLPTLKVYTISGSHDRQGLIAKAGTLSVTNLTLSTTPDTDGVQTHLINNGNTYTGLLAAEASGNVTLTNVTSSAALKITGAAGNNNSRAAGLIAQVTSNDTLLTFTNCTWNGLIQDEATGNDRCAGFLAYSDKNNTQYHFTGCFVKGTINKTQKVDYVSVGGLISALSTGTNITLVIDGLEVNGANITAAGSNAGVKCGGLLGYEWFNVTATLSNITVTSSSLNAGNSNFGGLVYKGSGCWTIGKKDGDTYKPGITFGSGNSFTGVSPAGAPSGLFICHGDKVDESITESALYLEVLPGAYTVDSSVKININGSEYFDELVGTSIGSGGNGIVSIATPNHDPIDSPACNTYQKQLSTDYDNPHTRYYYNLDKYRTDVYDTEDIDTPEEMVVLSARGHCHSGLQQYFTLESNKICGTGLNLTGYSYYPIPFSGQTIVDATITFDYEGLETAEETGALDGTENKKPSNPDCQHKDMHTGLFTTVINGSDSTMKLNVTNLTLEGTVGKSAIINDLAKGNKDTAKLEMTINGVNLNGIRIYPTPANYPLLIQSIGDFSTLNVSSVKTTGAYHALDEDNNVVTFYAASSLIGTVGSESGRHIQLEFSDMVLDGRLEDVNAEKSATYGTYHTIFTNALFLQAFDYSDGNTCRGVYNFIDTDQYTLGKELSNTNDTSNAIYTSGRNDDLQFWFFQQSNYVCEKVSSGSDPKECFATGYLRYVGTKENSDNHAWHHELDINLSKPEIISGCGTYSDPYLIDNYLQLKAIAELLSSENGTVEGMQVTLNVGNNGVIKLDKSFGPQNGHIQGAVDFVPSKETSEETGGTTSGESGESTGTAENTGTAEGAGTTEGTGTAEGTGNTTENTTPSYGDCQDVVFTCTDGKWTSRHNVINDLDGETVRTYLRNAYYKLDGTIYLPSDWSGLGSSESKKAFSGVIVGGEVHLDPKNGSFYQFGGLIKYSQGSVVKDVTIVYDSPLSVKCDEVPSGTDASFFGGVIGWCMGGDNIIDGVTVTYTGAPSVSGTYPYLAAVGGYVGLVGGTEGGLGADGLGGGVVFRNISSGTHPGLTVGGDKANYFYFNPYVGRVLDGYAVSEGTDFLNGDKNYTIPGISGAPDGSHLSRETIDGKDTVIVNDDVGLWLLSAIANSGAGNAASCNAYKVGKARTCDYEKVGQSSGASDRADETNGTNVYLGGDESRYKTTSYLTSASSNLHNLTAGAVSIALSKNKSNLDMTRYGNGFRGIGTSYGDNSSESGNYRLIKLSSLIGNNKIVTLAQDRKEYAAEKSNWTTMGTGLFTTLCCFGTVEITNLTLSGSTAIVYYKDTTGIDAISSRDKDGDLLKIRLQRVGAGMLAGSLAKVSLAPSIAISNVVLSNAIVNKNSVGQTSSKIENVSSFAGGLIGLAWNGSKGIQEVAVTNCVYNSLAVTGLSNAGGVMGYVGATESNITSFVGNDGTIQSTMTKCFTLNGTPRDGVGGLVGYCDGGEMVINNVTLCNLNVSANVTNGENDVGGLVGTWRIGHQTNCSVSNITMTGTIKLIGSRSTNIKSNVGGIAGFASDEDPNGDWSKGTKKYNMFVSNFKIGNSGNDTVVINSGTQIGGLFGLYKTGSDSNYGKLSLKDIHIGSSGSTVSLLTGKNVSGDHTVSGLVGTLCLYPKVTVDATVLTNVNFLSGKYAAALFARTANQNGNNSLTIDVRNTVVDGCTVAIWTKNSAGFIYGRMDNSKTGFTGTNILIRNSTIGYLLTDKNALYEQTSEVPKNLIVGVVNSSGKYCSYSTTGYSSYNGGTIGIFGGSHNGSNKSLMLVGVSLWNNKTPSKDFGADPENGSYVIRADYLAKQTGDNNIFDDSASPFVTTSPITNFNGIGYRSSDGVAFLDGTTTPIAQGIVQDYLDSTSGKIEENLIHFSVKEAMKTFCTDTSTVNTAYFSTFNTAGENGIAGVTDFPVLVINSTEAKRADSIVKNYISLLTNASSSLPTSIVATGYKLNAQGTAFEEASKKSLTVNGTTITVGSDKFDNQQGTFTLLDVQYADPAGGSNAYHLYIPVIVKKVLEFKFWAAAENGTTYKAENYEGLFLSAIGSNKDQITALLTFEYQRTQDEWQTAVANGENLLWNFSKELYLSPSTAEVALSSANMILVDRNDQNKAYYRKYTGGGGNVKFSDFTSVSDDSPWSAKTVPLCDLLGLTAEEWTANAKNKYYKLGNKYAEGATLRVRTEGGYEYYRPAEDSESGDNIFSINVGSEGEFAKETYYLTLQTEVTGDTLYNFLITCPDHLEYPIDIKGNEATGMPTTRIGSYVQNSDENRVVISDFFTQKVTVTTISDTLMSDANNAIQGTLETKITFANSDAKDAFIEYAGKRNLYQYFRLYLKMVDTNGKATSVPFVAGTTLNTEPVGSEGIHSLPYRENEIKNWGISEETGLPYTTISTDFTLEYSSKGIIDQFPTRILSKDENGIQVWAESVLSLDQRALERSNIREMGNDAKTFYRNDVGLATLSYNAYDDTLPTQASGLSKLGINGWEPSDTRINSVAGYNCSAVTGAPSANTLKLEMQLYRKNDSGAYIPLDYSSYVDLSKISALVMGTGTITPKEGDPFSFQLDGFDGISPILIEIDLDVKTGSELEVIDGYYANYKVKLTAKLYHGDTLISNSQADDYIIYTNAKIISSLIS